MGTASGSETCFQMQQFWQQSVMEMIKLFRVAGWLSSIKLGKFSRNCDRKFWFEFSKIILFSSILKPLLEVSGNFWEVGFNIIFRRSHQQTQSAFDFWTIRKQKGKAKKLFNFLCNKITSDWVIYRSIMDDRTVDTIFQGSLENLPPVSSKIVRIFTSSTFTGTFKINWLILQFIKLISLSDTLMERNNLMSKCYPRIKDYCREKHGLEFQVRWSYIFGAICWVRHNGNKLHLS